MHCYSGTPPYDHLVITTTFWLTSQNCQTFFCKKKNKQTNTLVNTAIFFWPIGDRIIGAPLYDIYTAIALVEYS